MYLKVAEKSSGFCRSISVMDLRYNQMISGEISCYPQQTNPKQNPTNNKI